MADDEHRFSTDEIISVYEHLPKQTDKSWPQCMAEHGLDPEKVMRALSCVFESGEGRLDTAGRAFVLGLQFGAMRLDAFPYDPEAVPPCDCFFCTLRRSIEGGGGEADS